MVPICLIFMNNRDYKQFAPGSTYHLYNRGVGKMNIFPAEEDFFFFLRRLKEILFPSLIIEKGRRYIPTKLPEGAFDLLTYCLMPNHFHLCILQNTGLPISALMEKLCTSYSKYYNKKYKRIGSLFQDQFKAVLVESDEQLMWLTYYIHGNPLKAKLVSDLRNYPYSSYLDYLGLRKGTLCSKDLVLEHFESIENYKDSMGKFDEDFLSDELKIDNED